MDKREKVQKLIDIISPSADIEKDTEAMIIAVQEMMADDPAVRHSARLQEIMDVLRAGALQGNQEVTELAVTLYEAEFTETEVDDLLAHAQNPQGASLPPYWNRCKKIFGHLAEEAYKIGHKWAHHAMGTVNQMLGVTLPN